MLHYMGCSPFTELGAKVRLPQPSADLERRKVVSSLLTFPLLAVFPFGAMAGEGASLQERGDKKLFLDIARKITGLSEFPSDLKEGVWKTISQEPWASEHLHRLARQIDKNDFRPDVFPAAERWFAGHILTTLVMGIYYHTRGNESITYNDALMFWALKDVRPIPGQCSMEFGEWADAPSASQA